MPGTSDPYDLLVVGGGINGVGIARDAARRGLKVGLCEKGDLGGATSSASSKMIHGGLRYLEHFAFRLVRESLTEREILLRMAPHLVRPMRFVLPHAAGSRPRWLVRTGLWLYDHIGGGRTLPPAQTARLREGPYAAPLNGRAASGFLYSDCIVDDARLVVANARDAARRGAEILPRTALIAARRDGALWRATLRDAGGQREIAARVLVNAAGPWVKAVQASAGLSGRAGLRLVKGSHIVVPRLYLGDHAYLLQNDDRRVVFVIPFHGEFTLIGTTEAAFMGDPASVAVTEEEAAYLCRAVGNWFRDPPKPDDVVWDYAGVRPLYEDSARDASAVSRDYHLEIDEAGAPALSIFGGKLTTFRRLAETALARLARHLPRMGTPWTAASVLPGGEDWPSGGAAAVAAELRRDHRLLDDATALRLAGTYGTDARTFLAEGPGPDLGTGLSAAELRWLVREEWARTVEDVLWRRTKLGLGAGEIAPAVADCFARGFTPDAPAAAPLRQTPDP